MADNRAASSSALRGIRLFVELFRSVASLRLALVVPRTVRPATHPILAQVKTPPLLRCHSLLVVYACLLDEPPDNREILVRRRNLVTPKGGRGSSSRGVP